MNRPWEKYQTNVGPWTRFQTPASEGAYQNLTRTSEDEARAERQTALRDELAKLQGGEQAKLYKGGFGSQVGIGALQALPILGTQAFGALEGLYALGRKLNPLDIVTEKLSGGKLQGPYGYLEQAAAGGRRARQADVQTYETIGRATGGSELARQVTATGLSVAPSFAAGPAGFSAMVGAAGLQSFGGAFADLRQRKESGQTDMSDLRQLQHAATAGLITAATTAGFGRTGIEQLANPAVRQGIKAGIMTVLKGGAAEVPEEALDEFLNGVYEKYGHNPNVTWADIGQQTKVGGIAGGVFGGAAVTPVALGQSFGRASQPTSLPQQGARPGDTAEMGAATLNEEAVAAGQKVARLQERLAELAQQEAKPKVLKEVAKTRLRLEAAEEQATRLTEQARVLSAQAGSRRQTYETPIIGGEPPSALVRALEVERGGGQGPVLRPEGEPGVIEGSGGLVSFLGEAGQIPTARQAAESLPSQESEQARLMQGGFVPSTEEGRKQFQAPEPEERLFVTEAEKLLGDRARLGLASNKSFEGSMLWNRIVNRTNPTDVELLRMSGFEEWVKAEKRTPEEAAQWLRKNGPRVEVKTFGEGAASPERKRYLELEHQLDTIQPDWRRLSPEDLGQTGQELLEEYRALGRTPLVAPSDAANWQHIAPKPESDMPGYVEGAVVLPLKEQTAGGLTKAQRGELFSSSHFFPPNTLAFFRGYMETLPNGKKVFHVIEVQSDWGQKVRELKEESQRRQGHDPEMGDAIGRDADRTNHPLLRDYNRLALKTAIEHARKEGADAIAISDAETAMMTEGHDLAASNPMDNPIPFTEPLARDLQKAVGLDDELIDSYRKRGQIDFDATELDFPIIQEVLRKHGIEYGRKITQEPGMRLNYDTILPKIAKELTGSEGERVEFGEHKMAFEDRNRNALDMGLMDEAGADLTSNRGRVRQNLIFRNPDGTPKTTVTATLFPLGKAGARRSTGEPFSLTRRSYAPPTQEETARLVEVGLASGSGTAATSIEAISTQTRDRESAELARFFKRHFGQALESVPIEVKDVPWSFAQDGRITIGQHGRNTSAPVVLHEVAHALTSYVIRNPTTEIQRSTARFLSTARKLALDNLPEGLKAERGQFDVAARRYRKSQAQDAVSLLDIMSRLGEGGHVLYALTNDDEFIASIFNSPAFRQYLNNIPYEGTTLWQRLKTRLMRALGIKRGTLLEKTFEQMIELGKEERGVMARLQAQEGGRQAQPPTIEEAASLVEESRPPLKWGDLYSEPMVERLRRLGGKVSQQVAREAQQIVSHTKRFYGELTPALDEARKLAGKLSSATTWAQKLNKVTDFAATSNFVDAVEGTTKPPEHAKSLIAALQRANLAIGRLAEQASPGFKATGKVQRILNTLGYDMVRRGGGPMWERFAEGLAKVNGKPVVEVKTFLRRWKKELDAPEVDTAHLDRISQDFVRRFPKTITHVKALGQWHEVIQATPFSYIEQAAQRVAHAVAFREVYAKDSGLLADTRRKVMAELETDRAKNEFDNLMRALQGHPLEARYGRWTMPDSVGGVAYQGAKNTFDVLKSLVLTANALVNIGETLSGGPTVFLGLRRTLTGMSKIKELYPQMERLGMVNKAIYNKSFDPSSPARSIARAASSTIREYTSQWMNELQEKAAAAAAYVVTEELKAGELSSRAKASLVSRARAMGMETVAAKKMVETMDEELISQFRTMAAARLTAGNQAVAERSRLGASRVFNDVFWFHSYAQARLNQVRGLWNNIMEDIHTGDWDQLQHDATLAGRMLGGAVFQGAITTGIIALAYGGKEGFEQRKREAQEEPFEFLTESALAALGGPVYLLWRTLQVPGEWRTNLAWTVAPLSMASEMLDAGWGKGRYEGLKAHERALEFVRNKTPGLRVVRTGMSLFGLAEHDRELDAAISGFYRWSREEFGPGGAPSKPLTEEKKNIRVAARRVLRELHKGGDVQAEMRAALDITTEDDLRRSLMSRRVLKRPDGSALTEENEQTLRRVLGDRGFEKLERYDAGVRHLADYFDELRAGKPLDEMSLRERVLLERERPGEPSDDTRMERRLSLTNRKFLESRGLKVELPGYQVSVRGESLRLSLEEERRLKELTLEEYERMIERFSTLPTNQTQERLDRVLAAARTRARARLLREMRVKAKAR